MKQTLEKNSTEKYIQLVECGKIIGRRNYTDLAELEKDYELILNGTLPKEYILMNSLFSEATVLHS